MRPDILDTEPRPEVAEKKLHVAHRSREGSDSSSRRTSPGRSRSTRRSRSSSAALNQFANAVEVYETMLQKWPMDPTAPETQNAIAETYDQLNITKRPGTPEHDATAQKALEARTKLANYIGNTPWVDANKDNPAAIQNAERLVRGGLRQAAAQHTNNGKAAPRRPPARRAIRVASSSSSRAPPPSTSSRRIGWFGLPEAGRERARRVREPLLARRRAPPVRPHPGRPPQGRAEDVSRAEQEGHRRGARRRDRRARLERGRQVPRQRGASSSSTSATSIAISPTSAPRRRARPGVEKREEVKFDCADEATRNVAPDADPGRRACRA